MAKKKRIAVRPERETAKKILERLWDLVVNDDKLVTTSDVLDLIDSNQTSLRFCLPTQLLGKLADPSLDAMCLQRGDRLDGQWDPRSFATHVIVPWNRRNQNVLGRSADPYVSNPLRRPRVDHGLAQMADREQWENLCSLLRAVEEAADPQYTEQILVQVLAAVRDRLRNLTFEYNVPLRISLNQVELIISRFLEEGSGGDRGLAVVAGLFDAFREYLGIYKEVRRGAINAADAATDSVGDLECIGPTGDIILAVEVKERQINAADVQAAVAKARKFSVRELFFCSHGVIASEVSDVDELFGRVWASGTNLYNVTILDFLHSTLPLLGESGIRGFVSLVGSQLDRFSTQPRHRQAWKNLLDSL
jgi:hypothetical protein